MIRMFFLMDGVGVGGSSISAAIRYRNSNVQAKYPQMAFAVDGVKKERKKKRKMGGEKVKVRERKNTVLPFALFLFFSSLDLLNGLCFTKNMLMANE